MGITCPSDSLIIIDLLIFFKIVHHSSSLFVEFNKATQKYCGRITSMKRFKYEKLFYNNNLNNNT
jgi:archaellum component FlaF (FlaF/FlaG flagellin family)